MNLDDAKEVFDISPSDQAAAQYLRVASQYWRDGMIEDATFGAIVERVAEWLADE